jgi:uncharacterized SAM-binding protein YcdF (DUF218 family)
MRHALFSYSLDSLARAAAACLGGFAVLNVIGERLAQGFDANNWWIDLGRSTQGPAAAALLAAGSLLIAFAIRPAMSRWRRGITAGCVVALLAITVKNAVAYYLLRATGQLHAGLAFPISLLIAALLGLVLKAVALRRECTHPTRALLAAMAVAALLLLAGPVVQMFGFGKTDYRRRADAIVVLGARVYADGRASDALADRVTTACALYHQGLAPRLIFSGGPGDGDVHETEGMRRLAIRLGVPDEAILLDPDGLDTAHTVRNTSALCDTIGARRILVVSHFYHLPRVKLAYQRAGRQVFTVPAKERYLLTAMPLYMAREVVAQWVYYLRPLLA